MAGAIDTLVLRVAFSASLKYHELFGGSVHGQYREVWKDVLNYKKLSPALTLYGPAGDVFASWFNELRFPEDRYLEIASQFFSTLEPPKS